MGFMDILGIVGSVATALTGGTTTPAATAAAAPAASIVAPKVQQPIMATARAQQTGLTGKQAARAGFGGQTDAGGVSGAASVFTQTVVQRVDRESGNVISEEVRRGSPWLMRSEVRALNRVTKMIRKADSKIKRKPAKVSDEMLRKAVREDINQLALIRTLTHHGHHNGS